jgi:Flp pilus assembly protein TadG
MKVGKTRAGHPERGATLAIVAMLLLVFLALTALAVDMGILYTARTSAQHAADAAALAGAFTFLKTTAAQPGAAQEAAIQVAASNRILGTPVAITAADVNVDLDDQLVTVTVRREGANGIATFFGRALGVNMRDVRVRATAQAALTATGTRCIKPVYFPNTVLSDKAPDVACTSSPPEVIFGNGGVITDFAKNKIAADQCQMVRPTRPQDVESQADIGAGQFFSIDFGSGADTYRCTWSSCLNNPACNTDKELLKCGNRYPVKTGDMVGPTHQGVDDLITDYGNSDPDTWVAPWEFARGGDTSELYDTSRSLGTFPVWNNCSNITDADGETGIEIRSGTAGQQAKLIGFVEVFVQGMDNKNGCEQPAGGGPGAGPMVKIYALHAVACGITAGPDEGNDDNISTGPFATPIRLVQNPPEQ